MHLLNVAEEVLEELNSDETLMVTNKSTDPDDCSFLVCDDALYNTSASTGHMRELVYDSGASRSTVCNLSLLHDPTPVTKQLSTYGGHIKVTHVGKLNIGGTTIYPVFYAPDGPRNLISATQLEDHGLRVVHKHRTVLVKLADRIIYRFPRIGNLYLLYYSPPSDLNLARITSATVDWHITLGHPSDLYLKAFLKLHNLPTPTPFPSSNKCSICSKCKIKSRPHSNPLPVLPKPFHRLHMDVLQISPPCKQSLSYILAIIDNFSRFNRIYMLRNKSEAEDRIMGYVHELNNQLDITPAFSHCNCGREFGSTKL